MIFFFSLLRLVELNLKEPLIQNIFDIKHLKPRINSSLIIQLIKITIEVNLIVKLNSENKHNYIDGYYSTKNIINIVGIDFIVIRHVQYEELPSCNCE